MSLTFLIRIFFHSDCWWIYWLTTPSLISTDFPKYHSEIDTFSSSNVQYMRYRRKLFKVSSQYIQKSLKSVNSKKKLFSGWIKDQSANRRKIYVFLCQKSTAWKIYLVLIKSCEIVKYKFSFHPLICKNII